MKVKNERQKKVRKNRERKVERKNGRRIRGRYKERKIEQIKYKGKREEES
jgi:hypothetical protein